MTEEFDLDELINDAPDPDEPLGAKVDRLTRGIRGLLVAFVREKQTSRRVRRLSVGLGAVAVVAAGAALAAIVIAVSSYRQSNRLDTLLDQFVADRNQRRVDACEVANESREANRGLVELDKQSSLLFARVLVDPALGEAQGRPPRTPEQEAATKRLLDVFGSLYTQATDPLREQILDGLKPLDCSPEALGVTAGPTATSTPSLGAD